MLDFLDGDRNKVGRPNENYGRELMELFVLGVSDLNGADNYTQTDVQEMARALTGFQILEDVGQFVPSRFDGGSKTLFSGKGFQATGVLGVVENPGGTAPIPPEAQVPLGPAQNIIDILFTHRDSDGKLTMPRFLAKKLWEWFAYPKPSKALLDELTVDFIAGGFVVSDLLRAIFLHDEFYGAQAKAVVGEEPVRVRVPRDAGARREDERQDAAGPDRRHGADAVRSADRSTGGRTAWRGCRADSSWPASSSRRRSPPAGRASSSIRPEKLIDLLGDHGGAGRRRAARRGSASRRPCPRARARR